MENSNYKLVGNINLARLSNVGVINVKGNTSTKKCLVIPIEENDLYIKAEPDETGSVKLKIASVGVEVYSKRPDENGNNADQYGNTHYIKASVSKSWIDSHTREELEQRNKIYLGDLKPMEIPSSNQASTVQPQASVEAEADDNLPF